MEDLGALYWVHMVPSVQGGEDSLDALSCRSFFAKEPCIIGLFGVILMVLLRKMTYEDKTSYDSTPPCSELTFGKLYQPFGVFSNHLSVSFLELLFNSLSYLQWHFPKPEAKLKAKTRRSLCNEALQKRPTSFSFELWLAEETYELYSVAKTHRMPWVTGHFSKKSH